jgi:para-nitrobenzyl esterase
MRALPLFLCAIAIPFALAACATRSSSLVPVTAIGDVEIYGRWAPDGRVAAFLGLPFAAAPIGALRWRPPQPMALPASIDASAFAPACMQGRHIVDWYGDLMEDFGADRRDFPVPAFSEDCLYLNVWTPSPEPDAALPVMVWIHGGGHLGGWAYEPNYIGAALAARGAVVVSIAYRLDVFGFFSHPQLPQSNFGLLDQIAALEWVAANIGAFGGDPGNVTLIGESAGAASAGYLMVSPRARGLFRRVVHQSAGYEFIHEDHRESFTDAGERLALQVAGGDFERLRSAPAADILAAAREVYADYQPDAVVDGDTLTEVPADSLAAGRIEPIDVIIGTNADEWRMYLEPDTGTAEVDAWLAEHAADPDAVRAVVAADVEPLRQLDRLITAREFVCPSIHLADAVSRAGRDAYLYRFTRVRPGALSAELGAYHGAEIPYLFDTHDDWLPTAAADRELGRTMAGYWLRFAASGNPNDDENPGWPVWDASAAVLEFGDRVIAGRHPETDLCRALAGKAPGT